MVARSGVAAQCTRVYRPIHRVAGWQHYGRIPTECGNVAIAALIATRAFVDCCDVAKR